MALKGNIRKAKSVLRAWDRNIGDDRTTGNELADALELLLRELDPAFTRNPSEGS